MRVSRRQMLVLGAGAAGVAVGLGASAERGLTAHTLNVIRTVFGPEFADQPAALDFAQTYAAFVRDKGASGRMVDLAYRFGAHRLPVLGRSLQRIDDSIIDKFAMSTNVILAAERGEPLVFVALFHPYEAACANQLSANARD